MVIRLVNIAERAVSLNQEPQLQAVHRHSKSSEIVESMVKDVLDALSIAMSSWPGPSAKEMIWWIS